MESSRGPEHLSERSVPAQAWRLAAASPFVLQPVASVVAAPTMAIALPFHDRFRSLDLLSRGARGVTPTPLWRALLVADAARGVAAAHAAGVVLRDVKPGNCIVGDDGVARLADFELSGTPEELAAPAPKWRPSGYLVRSSIDSSRGRAETVWPEPRALRTSARRRLDPRYGSGPSRFADPGAASCFCRSRRGVVLLPIPARRRAFANLRAASCFRPSRRGVVPLVVPPRNIHAAAAAA